MIAKALETASVDSADLARLHTIKCSELQDKNTCALSHLFLAATKDGIFYLDFEDSQCEGALSRSVHDIGRLSRDIFDLPLEEKLSFDIDLMGEFKLNGYKPIGRNKGGISGHRDGFESYAISQDTIASDDVAVQHPAAVAEQRDALTNLTSVGMEMTRLILESLSSIFAAPDDKTSSPSLESLHSPSPVSDTADNASPLNIIRLLKYPNAIGSSAGFSIPQLAHADMGSLTFLFTRSPGLQILSGDGGDDQRWLDVAPPPPGRLAAIVNFGDALKILSGGAIKSVVHRVVTVPQGAVVDNDNANGGQRARDRYSFAMLVRPAAGARMKTLPCFQRACDGDVKNEKAVPAMTCEEWVSMRFSQLRAR